MIKTCAVCGVLPSSDDTRQVWDATLQAYQNRYLCDTCWSRYQQWLPTQPVRPS